MYTYYIQQIIYSNKEISVEKQFYQEDLKISNGQSESGYRRRTDNTMAKQNVQKDKQRYIKHTHKTKDRVTRTPLKTGDELGCSRRVSSFPAPLVAPVVLI